VIEVYAASAHQANLLCSGIYSLSKYFRGQVRVCAEVRGYSPLAPLYTGPYEVASRSTKVFTLKIGGRLEGVSVDRLKPHLSAALVSPVSPPARGRPTSSVGPAPASGLR